MTLLRLLIGALAASTVLLAATPPAGRERPNLICILLDDARWDEFGAVGHPWAKTPNFDRVARESAIFRNAFSVTPLCSPSRGTIMTGQYAHARHHRQHRARAAQPGARCDENRTAGRAAAHRAGQLLIAQEHPLS